MNTPAILLLFFQIMILVAASLKARRFYYWFFVAQVVGALLNAGIVAVNIFAPSLFYNLSSGASGAVSMNSSAILVRDALTIGGLLLFSVGYFVEAIRLPNARNARPEPK